jgi:hypothetical protein
LQRRIDQKVFIQRIAIRQGTAALRFLSRLHDRSWAGALITTASAARTDAEFHALLDIENVADVAALKL